MRLLTCVQSQERDHAFFSLGLRTRTATYAAVRAEYDDCAFLRTHILRPTWHFVLPEDLRWILAATSERVIRGMAYRHAQVGLADPRHVERSLETLVGLLSGRTFLTRQEIGARFDEHDGLPRKGEQLGHLLLLAELRALICSGPLEGVHHTYALVDEVVPPTPVLEREEGLARLAHRFFAGHGSLGQGLHPLGEPDHRRRHGRDRRGRGRPRGGGGRRDPALVRPLGAAAHDGRPRGIPAACL